MAESPAHKFGQIIGDVLETAMEPMLHAFADQYGLFLDKKGPRPARAGNKLTWVDLYGNTHDLDFVLERGGTSEHIGTPVAFIETAWRRYTKHSRNKAQEIQGAILPLVSTHHNVAPFIGVVLAGVFTDGAMTQLRSQGFAVLYFSYDSIVEAFRRVGVDASFDEETPDAAFAQKIARWERLPQQRKQEVSQAFCEINTDEVDRFKESLRRSVTRTVALIRILPLHGTPVEWRSVDDAINFIESYNEANGVQPVVKYEVEIRYSNDDRINGQFAGKDDAIRFLRSYQIPQLRPL